MPEAACSTTDLDQDDIESIVVGDGSADEAQRNGCTPAQEIKIIVVVLEKSHCG